MEDIIREALKRLEAIGYKAVEEDTEHLEKINHSIEEYIKSFCNTSRVAEGLFNAQRDCLCAEFLLEKKSAGLLKLNDLNLGREIKSIQEGDVSVVYNEDSLDKGKEIDRLIEHYISRFRKELLSYRCVKWS